MTPTYKNVHNRFKLNNYHYNYEDLMEVAYSFTKEGEPYQVELGLFLLDWLDREDFVEVQTSGSTGKPKKIKIKKQAMVNSAIVTGDFFNLTPGKKILNCLPSNFIAGKMMIVRAVILGLELDIVKPSANPRIDLVKDYDFCAFTPLQLKNFAKYLKSLKTAIVGGGRVSNSIKEMIQDKKTQIYETFGMTETISHIAVRKLNNFTGDDSEKYFQTLPGVTVSKDERDCLVIEAPHLTDEKLVTNDIVEVYSNTTFDWLGRYDNVINSGGIKLYPEQIEQKLRGKIKGEFFVSSLPDDELGEKLVLLIEGEENSLNKAIFETLNKYEVPKNIYYLPKFAETLSGKIHRQKTLKLLK
ncbi:AMP-binding protein [Seonamhaeicola sediminis]|uniref:AMP-binding protein n=1 Tax=Seonamhaeicola sediminis TaxID=2528206 RepID=A0A562YEC6_9FLAO|nr:AMP-binding protein [Seonamhaeicola sediminis]TWO32978.1 AMP-binding protein [Seonamhaeicola sediminis]